MDQTSQSPLYIVLDAMHSTQNGEFSCSICGKPSPQHPQLTVLYEKHVLNEQKMLISFRIGNGIGIR